MVNNWLDYFQLVYISILFPFYLYFTIHLGYKIYFVKVPVLYNEFFPIIFYKGVIDNITFFVQFTTSRIQKYHVLTSFFLSNSFLSYILYFVTSATYFIMFQIAFLTSFNRYIAISKPLKYKEYFHTKKLLIYFLIMSILGIVVGTAAIIFPCSYVYYPEINRVSATCQDQKTAYVHTIVALFLNLPLLIITAILNFCCIYKSRFISRKNKSKISKDYKIVIYNTLLFFVMVAFEVYFLFKNLPYILQNYYFLETLALQSLSWIIDAMTFGIFLFSLVLS
uniref:G_PROTEIN_RECEP_F1_2 domain-containing protein n=1 Tax=Strongyloides papillosus TaxID=174720 RepID=A0A0N5CA52_STREA